MRVMRELVGEVLGNRYRLVALISGGGMGEVFRGHDLLLDRPVAIKVLHPALAADPELVQRFRAEARAAARLTHPNIVSVHDWGAGEDLTYYMVMEYVPGRDLRDVLMSRIRIEPAQAATIVASVCDALGAAHASGIVHRDVKPENVLIARDGTAKVADFGIAAVVGTDAHGPGGHVTGTLRYLSPEQARGQDAVPASDLWGAGALLAECVTGEGPTQAGGRDFLRRRAEDPPIAPTEFDPGLPTELDAIVLKACAPDPNDRYASAAEMAAELRAIASSLDEAEPVASLLDDVTGEVRLDDIEPTTFVRGKGAARRGRGRRKVTVGRAVAAAFVLVLLAVVAAVAVPALTGPKMVDVPDVAGLTRAEAEVIAEEVGLEVSIERARSPEVVKGEVISQRPAAGTLEEGSVLTLVVSAGPPLIDVPDITGLTVDRAGIRLRAFHLDVGQVTHKYAPEEEGTIIAQDPAEGRLEWGRTVDVTVSKGPEPITVPDVTGLEAEKAASKLKDAGFEVDLVNEYSDDVPAGRVISTDPPGGVTAEEGGVIRVLVSLGPEFEKLTMPDVRGMTIEAATAKLENMGLRVSVVQSCGGGGTIVAEQEPLPGTTVRENRLVQLYTC